MTESVEMEVKVLCSCLIALYEENKWLEEQESDFQLTKKEIEIPKYGSCLRSSHGGGFTSDDVIDFFDMAISLLLGDNLSDFEKESIAKIRKPFHLAVNNLCETVAVINQIICRLQNIYEPIVNPIDTANTRLQQNKIEIPDLYKLENVSLNWMTTSLCKSILLFEVEKTVLNILNGIRL